MKKFRFGFSLAEILITVGIISVIATMGFSIAKNSIDRAYDLYVYSGYKQISDAIADANAHGKHIDWTTAFNAQPFPDHLASVLDTSYKNITSDLIQLKTKNGIIYTISKGYANRYYSYNHYYYNYYYGYGTYYDYYYNYYRYYYDYGYLYGERYRYTYNFWNDYARGDDTIYYIQMDVPTRAVNIDSKLVTKKRIILAYMPGGDFSTLLPVEILAEASGSTTKYYYQYYSTSGSYIYKVYIGNSGANSYSGNIGNYNYSIVTNIADRKDLLPFYIDDGKAGRYIPDVGYTKKTYYSAREAFCRVYDTIYPPVAPRYRYKCWHGSWYHWVYTYDWWHPGAISSSNAKPLIDCSSITTDKGTSEGFVRAENPRKVW